MNNSYEWLDVGGHEWEHIPEGGLCEDLGDGSCPWWPICQKGKTMIDMREVNSEGLTLDEWVRAANHCRTIPLDSQVARKAWNEGEDPTEYAGK